MQDKVQIVKIYQAEKKNVSYSVRSERNELNS